MNKIPRQWQAGPIATETLGNATPEVIDKRFPLFESTAENISHAGSNQNEILYAIF